MKDGETYMLHHIYRSAISRRDTNTIAQWIQYTVPWVYIYTPIYDS